MDPPGRQKSKLRSFFRNRKKDKRNGYESSSDDEYVHVKPVEPSIQSDPPLEEPLPIQQQVQPSDQNIIEDHRSSGASSHSRKSLHHKAPTLSTYQSTPISKHYEISQQILSAFDSNWNNHIYVTAYAVGLQFVELALLEIPKHGYFHSQRHERERMENSLEAARVAHLLKDLVTSNQVKNGDIERIEKLLGLAISQVEYASNDQEQRQETRRELEENRPTDDWVVCEPLLLSSCSDVISGIGASFSSIGHRHSELAQDPPPSMMIYNKFDDSNDDVRVNYPPALYRGTLRDRSSGSSASGIPAPPPPLCRDSSITLDHSDRSVASASRDPSGVFFRDRSDISMAERSLVSVSSIHTTEEILLEKALFLSGLEVSEANDIGYVAEASPSPERLELTALASCYHEDFDSLQEMNRVHVSLIDTYQGKLAESTNGCAMIAPLLAMHHLDSPVHETEDPGIPNHLIEHTIDVESPHMLQSLRRKLQLSEFAFLVPADAHDYLLSNSLLKSEQFVTVTGGNILNESHLTVFLECLEKTEDSKVAATLFFHEHVTTILKLRRVDRKGKKSSTMYDFIDSLPLKATLCRVDESPMDLCERLGVFDDLDSSQLNHEMEQATLPRTARFRCHDSEALMAVLKWYACSKFNEDNIKYIDNYPWDDASCDFDPRVFQAFVWGNSVPLPATANAF